MTSSSPEQSQSQLVFEFLDAFEMLDRPLTQEVFDYRMSLLDEEYDETVEAAENGDAEGVVDGHVDLIVIALGNLMLFGVDADEAFSRVMNANMQKVIGARSPGDPTIFSVTKPEGWQGPDHSDNHGGLDELFRKD